MSAPGVHVPGKCPACQAASLMTSAGGHLVCTRLDCPNPTAVDELLHSDVVPAKLGWSNPDTGPANVRLYATDQGDSPRWARPRARVVEDALTEQGRHEGDRFAVVYLGGRSW